MEKLWVYNEQEECFAPDVRKLPQPLIHMLASGPEYFSICDSYLRGYSGFDYTRMFGEFDGPYFPKQNGRFLWFRFENGSVWLANKADRAANPDDRMSFSMGLGYARFINRSKKAGIDVQATVLVPQNDTCELWAIEITNTSRKKKVIDFIPTVPIFGGNRAYNEYHRDVVRLYNKSRISNHIEIHPGLEWVEGKTEPSEICYFMSASSDKGKFGDRFYSDRETFLGPDYSWEHPEAILNDLPPRFQCLGEEPVGAIEFKKLSLLPNETIRFVVICGIAQGSAAAERMIAQYDYHGAMVALEKIKAFWLERTNRVTVTTRDKQFNILWNNWWCYQLSMRYWFGNTGHPQFDYGSDFAGWRDFWQDMMGATVIDPEGLEKRTIHTLEGIRLDGTNATRFFARTKEFGSDEINGLWCDHPYWTTQTVLVLINFLGDPEFLFHDKIPFFKDAYRDRGERKDLSWPSGMTGRAKTKDGALYTGSVLEHLLVQLVTMFYDVGRNNLLKQKRADWNDAVDQVKGENITFTMGFAQDCNELADCIEKLSARSEIKEIEVSQEFSRLIDNWSKRKKTNLPVEEKHSKLSAYLAAVNGDVSGIKVSVTLSKIIDDLRNKAAVTIETANKYAWNGTYYSGYVYDDGNPVDTIFKRGALRKPNPTSGEFEMMLMPQTWSLLSGAADRLGVEKKVLKAVFTVLADKKVGGLKLNYPPYMKFDKRIGRITGFSPGTKENNAVFCHANLFMVWALLRRRRAEDAYKIFSRINPQKHLQNISRTGPWIPEYYVSSDNPNYPGRGEYPLLTASAGWSRYLLQNYFLGVRGEFDGLRIDPCLPAVDEFRECVFTIHFRGAYYEIFFRNPRLKKNTAASVITVDGQIISGNLIAPFEEGKHTVEVILDTRK